MTTLAELGLTIQDVESGVQFQDWRLEEKQRYLAALDDSIESMKRYRAALQAMLQWNHDFKNFIADLVADLGVEEAEEFLQQGVRGGVISADWLADAQYLRDREWLTTEQARRIRGCSASYLRRLKLAPEDKRKRHDGTLLFRRGAIRKRRQS